MEGTNNIFQTTFCPQIPSDNNNAETNNTATAAAADQFIVEDLLNLSFDDADIISDANFLDSATGNSTAAVANSCNSSSFSGFDPNLIPDYGWQNNISDCHFSGDLCVPEDDLTDAGWLTNIVDDSFSGEELEKMQLISGMKVQNKDREAHEVSQLGRNSPIFEAREVSHLGRNSPIFEAREISQLSRNSPIFDNEVSVPAKARSKRTRRPPCDWTSRLLLVYEAASSSYEAELLIPTPTLPSVTVPKKQAKTVPRRKDNCDGGSGGDGRKCLHCATDKTPQWRTGPKGPKTLCNACGVRYKSGRLVPEYRPAASPTFVMTEHSNSHRKVLELRRQKEMLQTHPHQHNQFLQYQNMMFDMTPNADDYLIHQHVGPDFRHLL